MFVRNASTDSCTQAELSKTRLTHCNKRLRLHHLRTVLEWIFCGGHVNTTGIQVLVSRAVGSVTIVGSIERSASRALLKVCGLVVTRTIPDASLMKMTYLAKLPGTTSGQLASLRRSYLLIPQSSSKTTEAIPWSWVRKEGGGGWGVVEEDGAQMSSWLDTKEIAGDPDLARLLTKLESLSFLQLDFWTWHLSTLASVVRTWLPLYRYLPDLPRFFFIEIVTSAGYMCACEGRERRIWRYQRDNSRSLMKSSSRLCSILHSNFHQLDMDLTSKKALRKTTLSCLISNLTTAPRPYRNCSTWR